MPRAWLKSSAPGESYLGYPVRRHMPVALQRDDWSRWTNAPAGEEARRLFAISGQDAGPPSCLSRAHFAPEVTRAGQNKRRQNQDWSFSGANGEPRPNPRTREPSRDSVIEAA